MNIFLLFLTTILMIGYYVIYSPSQNLEHLETDNVIQTSDLRSVAECVIAAQNAAMDSVPYEDACVETYGVESHYVCTSNNYSVEPCDKNPDFNYIITHSKVLSEDSHAGMLKIIEKLYQDKGSFGIYMTPDLITADMSGRRTLHAAIAEKAGLQDGQLVYIMQYQIPYMYSYPINSGDPNSCPENSIAVKRYGRWLCLEPGSNNFCRYPYIYDSTAGCVLPPDDDCGERCSALHCNEDETCVCYGGGTVACVGSTTYQCDEGYAINVDPDTGQYTCIQVQEPKELTPCAGASDPFVYTNNKAILGRTLRVQNIHCGKCLKPTRICNETLGAYEYVCLPDASQIAQETSCYPDGDPDDCATTDTKGIYFGFNNRSRTDSLVTNNGQPVDLDTVLSDIETNKRDLAFHCKTCPAGKSVDFGESLANIVVTCKSSD